MDLSSIGSAIGTASSVVGQISSLFGGGGPLSLGSFSFKAFEVPETISFGGENAITTHKLGGAKRVLDLMGTNEEDITWSGILLSADAQSRAEILSKLRKTGDVLPLTFGKFFFHVLIASLHFEFHKKNHITYTIRVCVVDNTRATSGPGGLLGSVIGDLKSAAGAISGFSDQIQSALAPVASLASTIVTMTGGSSTALKLLQGVTSVQGVATAVSGVTSGNFASLAALPFGNGPSAAKAVSQISLLAQGAGAINEASNYLGRAATNLH